MPTHPLEQFFTLLGCISAVYIAARLIVKVLYHATVWAINRMEE